MKIYPDCTAKDFKADLSELCDNCPLKDKILKDIQDIVILQAKERKEICSKGQFDKYIEEEIDSSVRSMKNVSQNEKKLGTENDRYRKVRIEKYIGHKEKIKALNRLANSYDVSEKKNKMEECEKLDTILRYLDENSGSYPDMKEVCEACQIPFDRTYAIKLEGEKYIENKAKSKNEDGFIITKSGEYFINIEGGYCGKLKSETEKTLVRSSEPVKPISHETVTIQAKNVIYNKGSNVGDQSQKIKTEKQSKTNWLQILAGIIGIIAGGIAIYKFIIE